MKARNLFLIAVPIVMGLSFGCAEAQQIQMKPFDISPGATGNDANLHFADFSGTLAQLRAVDITLTVDTLELTGTFQGTSQNPETPSATLTDVISLSNVSLPPMAITEVDNVSGSGTLAQNASVGFVADDFLPPLPQSSPSSITAQVPNNNLSNFIGNDTVTLDIVSMMTASNLVGANIPRSNYELTGTVTVEYVVVPEPRPGCLLAVAGAVLLVLGWRKRAVCRP